MPLNGGNTPNYLDPSVGGLNYNLNNNQRDILTTQLGKIAQGAGVNAGEVFRTGGAGGAARRNQMLLQGATDMAGTEAGIRDMFVNQDLDAQRLRLENALAGEGAIQFDETMLENQRQFDMDLARARNEFDRQLAEGGRQFDAELGLSRDDLAIRAEQFAQQLGLERLDINSQNDMELLNLIMGMGLESGVNLLDYPDLVDDLLRRFS